MPPSLKGSMTVHINRLIEIMQVTTALDKRSI